MYGGVEVVRSFEAFAQIASNFEKNAGIGELIPFVHFMQPL